MKLSVRKQRKILNILVDLSREDKDSDNTIYAPEHFEDNFPFVSSDELDEYLKILQKEELIVICASDCPENYNISWLQITPAGLSYIPKLTYSNQQKWLDRIISFALGVLSGWILTYLIPMLYTSLQ